eukprot:gnl/TRDRNA2_/TRDRNA2_213152_c0_seq1.p1 gnl/TRDRNA2_/TRDRNA2_213152_c0~~gnl/TRDRNA2_/TRDRNA2_213152_c0_seq1.p1  ORF type:complete len:210 (+),score=34.96 gnl/TRDRNA2_/TRDRNA2_213152_c0_seq1:32-631(+)
MKATVTRMIDAFKNGVSCSRNYAADAWTPDVKSWPMMEFSPPDEMLLDFLGAEAWTNWIPPWEASEVQKKMTESMMTCFGTCPKLADVLGQFGGESGNPLANADMICSMWQDEARCFVETDICLEWVFAQYGSGGRQYHEAVQAIHCLQPETPAPTTAAPSPPKQEEAEADGAQLSGPTAVRFTVAVIIVIAAVGMPQQ